MVLIIKNQPTNAGDVGDMDLISGIERSPGGRHGNPLQYSFLENPMDRGAWQFTVYRVTQNWTQMKQFSTPAQSLFLISLVLLKRKKNGMIVFLKSAFFFFTKKEKI